MTADEKYDTRVELCRKLRIVENEIEQIAEIRDKYKQSNGNKRATLSIYVKGEIIEYELDKATVDNCIDFIFNSYLMKKDDIVQTLEQELR